ncbi:MAG TPA: carboxy terminal-processing peptidase [Candidatus Competibacteraceae bacterium]|nr:carboxy terminal-processing peptidase [Candidatus Competibacteraceae bacterium]
MRFRELSLSLLLAALLAASTGVLAAQPGSVVPAILAPQAKHKTLDQAIAGLLSHYHYRQAKLDDKLSTIILGAYLEALDFNRLYFLRSDVQGFERKYRIALDDALQGGDLRPAYEIFNLYQQRLAERTAWVSKQLQKPFDFGRDEELELERKNAPWAASSAELDEIWRKRLKNELLALMLVGQKEPEARKTLQSRYESRLKRTLQSNSEDVFQTYMNAVARSFDPHTAYFSPRASENFNIEMRLSLEGIGTVLRMEEEEIKVLELVPGGPADLSKQIKPGDNIIGVAQGDDGPMVDVVGWRLDDVVDLIRGQRGSVVRLQLIPEGGRASGITKTVRLVRDTVKLDKKAAQSEIKTLQANGRSYRIGVITIPTFYSDFAAAQRGDADYRSTTRDVRRLLEQLNREKIDGLLIDLRQNGGGSLAEAVELTGLFIQEGPVVQVRNSRGEVEVEQDPDPSLLYDGPLGVLLDRYSASASEIFAGAIQDYGRGLLIGDPTFGKGTVQTLIDLGRFMPRNDPPAGQLKLTVAKFYRVNGSSTQHKGVMPDISLPSAYDAEEVGESAQPQALPWDEIAPAPYRGSQRLRSLVPELNKLHQQRMDGEPALVALRRTIELAEQVRRQTKVSLLESRRRSERDRQEAELLMRQNELRTALGLPPLKPDQARSEDDKGLPDVLQQESIRIVADLAEMLAAQDRGEALVMSGQ